MTIYLMMFLLLGFFAILTWDRELKAPFFISAFLLLLITALRDPSIGSDTGNYVRYFLQPDQGYGEDSRAFETLYIVWNDVIRWIWKDGQYFLVCTAALNLIGFYVLIVRNSPYKMASLFLFATLGGWAGSFALMRQFSAISFYLISLHFFLNKKYLLFSIFFVVAFFFHATVLFVLPILLVVPYFRFKRKVVYAALLISFLFGLLNVINIEEVTRSWFSHFTGFGMIGRYSSGDDSEILSHFSDTYFRLKALLPLTAFTLVSCILAKEDDFDHLLSKLYILGVVGLNFLISFILANRVFVYLTLLGIVSIPILLRRHRYAKYVYVVFGSLFLYFRYTYFRDSPEMNPYKGILTDIF